MIEPILIDLTLDVENNQGDNESVPLSPVFTEKLGQSDEEGSSTDFEDSEDEGEVPNTNFPCRSLQYFNENNSSEQNSVGQEQQRPENLGQVSENSEQSNNAQVHERRINTLPVRLVNPIIITSRKDYRVTLSEHRSFTSFFQSRQISASCGMATEFQSSSVTTGLQRVVSIDLEPDQEPEALEQTQPAFVATPRARRKSSVTSKRKMITRSTAIRKTRSGRPYSLG